ncbi:MAG: N-acetylglucosaminyl-diphospho-decaprenol L-rhamnosyltransferase [Acidimicrobiaceae bacterium]|nr:N-acetylglucosaminyl-diphospho-decaprenol L-rhamnosyltransferase [Acidimicrobiaceae bacterium]
MKVAAVVVNYNGGDDLARCVGSLRSEGVDQLVVVDNGSTDSSLQLLAGQDPEAARSVVLTGRNLGYGGAANRGAASLIPPPDAVLVSNPDLVVHPATLKALAAALEADPSLGIVGPRLENPDGSLYPSARSFPDLADAIGHALLGSLMPGNRFSRRYKLLDWDHAGARRVDWVSGACFLTRWEVWQALGGFDESYFMYMEDVDLCWRAGRLGWGVAYEPQGCVTHVQGTAANQRPYRMIVAHHRSMLQFAARTETGTARLLLPLMVVGVVVRAALACVSRWLEGRRHREPDQVR